MRKETDFEREDMSRKSYLIFGANGMAGHVMAQYLLEQGHRVHGFARQEGRVCETIVGDARRPEDIRRALERENYDYVVNCIGVLNRTIDEHLVDGIYINSVLPHYLAEQLEGTETKLIHVSSDCVFAGDRGGYRESDRPDADDYYGRTKALGEVMDRKNLTLRTSIVGPELKENGTGLFHWFMSQGERVQGYQRVIWSGVTTLQLAKAVAGEVQNPQTGLHHLVNNETICKHDLLELFNRYCRQKPVEIESNVSVISDRSLLNTVGTEGYAVPSYEQMIIEMEEWMEGHPYLYGQYRDR